MPQIGYERLAKYLDHALLTPTSTDAELRTSCLGLREFPLATVCIQPHAVKLAVEELAGTSIDVCTVIGFPHGTPLPGVKAFETGQAFLDGAREVDMVVNTGKVLGGDWDYVREDISAVAAQGPRRVLLTLERGGSMIFGQGEARHVPAFPVAAVDTTAAGDTFCGALGVALLEGRATQDAAVFATAAAALSVTRAGAQPSIPFRSEIDRFLLIHA